MATGALCVSASAILIDLSGASPGTASFYRCLLALPVLSWLAVLERRRQGPLRRGQRIVAVAAGVLFAGDMLLWTQAILEVGAGLSTVLVNAQVLIVPLLAWLVDHEQVGRRFVFALPVMLTGILLTGGIFEHGVSGTDPARGTVHATLAALCYSGFLFLLRRSGRGNSAEHDGGRMVQSYTHVIAVAAAVSLLVGALWNGVTPAPGWAAIGWLALVALAGQILGWLFVALAAPHLASDVGAALLMLTPIGALVLGAVVLGERPTALQMFGCALVLGSAYTISVPARRSPGRQRS